MPIQGTAADVLKKAMIDVRRGTSSSGAPTGPGRMILTVHDELLFEVPEPDAAEVADLVRRVRWSRPSRSTSLTVDVGVGESWKAAKP